MATPVDLSAHRIIDTMIGFPIADRTARYEYLTRQSKDDETRNSLKFPAGYMFRDVPPEHGDHDGDPVDVTIAMMDRFGIGRGLVDIAPGQLGGRAVAAHPDRFVPVMKVDPNGDTTTIRAIRAAHAGHGLKAVSMFPAGYSPQVPINDRLMYPIYSTCCELAIPVFVTVGIPGPRVRFAPQHAELIDDVMFDFPELTFVTRHGCEPWTELVVKLMIKWPNLHYSTSAFAPKYYPRAVIDYANTRGADRIIYAGYYPFGLSLERIMSELPDVPLKVDVWPKFLAHNAERVLHLQPHDPDAPASVGEDAVR